MPVNADLVYKDRDTIVAELIASMQARIPDINVGADSVFRILVEVWSNAFESLFLANQLLHDDMFPQTANAIALLRYGELWGRPLKGGTKATGTVLFAGQGGIVIPLGTIVAAPSATDEALRYVTTLTATIPNPGIPSAPTAADGGAGALTGTFEYAVAFQTAAGETPLGAVSNALVIAAKQVALTAIPLGGTGTIGRRVYRRVNGGAWALTATIANNTATTLTDNNAAPSGTPLVDSTAERITTIVEAEDVGEAYNASIGTVTEISDALQGLTSVTNTTTIAGGTNEEDIEAFRRDLLEFIRSPKTGSMRDLEAWAEAIEGVEEATAFTNDNMGSAVNGHATVRITGPNGSVPSAGVIAAVLADLNSRDIANITLHVGTFTPVAFNVTVDATTTAGYLIADVASSVQTAISEYIQSVGVGGTVYIAGIIDAVFGLPGIATLSVTTPTVDTAVAATEKPIPGTITVT